MIINWMGEELANGGNINRMERKAIKSCRMFGFCSSLCKGAIVGAYCSTLFSKSMPRIGEIFDK